jgi:pimeloyl-ACP methyl ester carboxylesterase
MRTTSAFGLFALLAMIIGSRGFCAVAAPLRPQVTGSPIVEGLFDVGGHKLYLKCEGSGAPTVVYLHGIIMARGNSGGALNSGLIPSYLHGEVRVCIYDRANVGRSDKIGGPLTGEDSVRDLHQLLATAKIHGPYVLLGASFGGLIADMYAATYPADILGMVLLDASLPDDVIQIDERFLPKDALHKPDDWLGNAEQMDELTTYAQARVMQNRAPKIALTFIATTKLDLDPSWPVERMTAAIRTQQQAFVDHFTPGRLLILHDVPHWMEWAIPRTVADEVERVIASTKTKH